MIIFLSLLVLPLVCLNMKSSASTMEKRALFPLPKVFEEKTGRMNSDIFKHIDFYLNDRMGFRERLIQLYSYLKYGLLHKVGNDRAIFGKKEWLFYIQKSDGDNLSDFLKSNLADEQTVIKFANQIKNRAQWCEKNHIAFLFFIAPNKHNIYPEYYPIERPSGITRTDQFLNYLDKHNIAYLFPRDVLISQKNSNAVLYEETGSHWNLLGAYHAFGLLSAELHKKYPKTKFPDIEYKVHTQTVSGGSDIAPLLGLESFGKNTIVHFTPKGKNWTDLFTYIKNEGPRGVLTKGPNPSLPTAVIFRDSFFEVMVPFTSTLFSQADYRWKMFDEADKPSILANKPDIIIWEVCERYMHLVPISEWTN